jgi:group I intron endonuclease
MINVIYQIKSKKHPSKKYIGSSFNMKKRMQEHLRRLRSGKHPNIKLLRHVKKYGIEDLSFDILESCQEQDMIAREQFYIDKLEPWFNICKVAGRTIGVIQSDITKKKRGKAIALAVRNRTPEERMRVSASYRAAAFRRNKETPDHIGSWLLIDNLYPSSEGREVYATCMNCKKEIITKLTTIKDGYMCQCA